MKNTDFMMILNEIPTNEDVILVGPFNRYMIVSNTGRQKAIKVPCDTIEYDYAALQSDGVAVLAHNRIISTIPTNYISMLEVL